MIPSKAGDSPRARAPLVADTLRWLLGSVFVAAAVPKILDPEAFSLALIRYDLLPDFAVTSTAVFLPWLELVSASALLFLPSYRVASCSMLAALLAVFCGALGYALARGQTIPCGCFGGHSEADGGPWYELFRDVALLAVAAAVYFWIPDKSRPPVRASPS